MSAAIVNLNRARKAKKREDAEKQADANRAKFGRHKTERQREDAIRETERKRLEAHKRDGE
jgi:Domain of unknown function (DUF4169)